MTNTKKILLSGASDNTVKCYDVRQTMGMWTHKNGCGIRFLKKKNGMLLTGGTNGIVKVWDLATKHEPIQEINCGTSMFSLDFDDKKLRVGYPRKIRLWDFAEFDEKHNYEFKRAKFMARLNL